MVNQQMISCVANEDVQKRATSGKQQHAKPFHRALFDDQSTGLSAKALKSVSDQGLSACQSNAARQVQNVLHQYLKCRNTLKS